MKKFKAQLHTHTKSDPDDVIYHDEVALIDRAAHYNFDVLAITCHNKLVFNDDLHNYADSKNILLIPGIERTIFGRHVLILNAHKESEQIKSFDELETYKKDHPECLLVAPHPFHPMPYALKELFKKAEHLFDAIEWSCFHTKRFKFNEKAVKKAVELNLPLLATGDNHVLKFLNYTYSYIFAAQKSISHIIDAIKKGNIQIQTQPMSMMRLSAMTARLATTEYIKKFYKAIKKKFTK
jgi:predicted metal-dependent phosphoesterase TrpH